MVRAVKAVKAKKTRAPAIDPWEVTSAVDTLKRAEEIKVNPNMMRAVAKEVASQKKALDKVAKQTKPAKKK